MNSPSDTPNKEIEIFYFLKITVITAFLVMTMAVIFVVFFLPIYTDETVWKLLLGRYYYDGNQEISLTVMPACGIYAKPVPWPLVPFRLLNQALYADMPGPLFVRIFGVVLEAAWFLLTWWLLADVVTPKLSRRTVAIGILAFSMLGIMPFLLEFGRPEKILLLGMTVFFLPMLKPTPRELPRFGTSIFHVAWIWIAAAFLLTSHPRAVFAVPLILLFMQRMVRRWPLVALGTVTLAAFEAIAFHDFSSRWICPGDPSVDVRFRQLNLASNLDSRYFGGYVHQLIGSLGNPGTWFLSDIVQKRSYISDMIPPFTNKTALGFGVDLWEFMTLSVLLGGASLIVAFIARWRERDRRATLLTLGSMWGFFALSIVARIDKLDYEAALLVPLIALTTFASFWIAWPVLTRLLGARAVISAARLGFALLLVCAFVSQIALLANFGPYAFGGWSAPGYPAGQRFSVSGFGYETLRPQIIATAAKCGIRPEDRLNHLVVDELTYFSFQKAYQPFFMTYLDEHGWGRDHPDPTDILRRYRSAGMIVGCQWIPSVYRARAIANGRFCCLPKFS